jgi:polysaccharide export outer membrane protein
MQTVGDHGPEAIAATFGDRRPPPEIKFGIGDVVSVTIFEASAGGLFIPLEAGVRPGNFVTLPNQPVDTSGNISVPYAGVVRAAGKTPTEVQREIVGAIKNRAIDPQAVVALATQNTSLISVLGEVNNPNRFPAQPAGEHILDAITRGGGIKDQGYDNWVVLERKGRRAAVPFGALIFEPTNNVWVWPNDTIYVFKQPQTFLAFGAAGQQGQFNFDMWRITLAEAVAKAGGLLDVQADPASVYLYRREPRDLAAKLGVDVSKFPGPLVPVIYSVSFRDPAGYFLATKMQMHDKDIVFAANAASVELTKFLTLLQDAAVTGQYASSIATNW